MLFNLILKYFKSFFKLVLSKMLTLFSLSSKITLGIKVRFHILKTSFFQVYRLLTHIIRGAKGGRPHTAD